MEINYAIALIGVGGTVAGTLLGVLLGYRLTLLLAKTTAKHNVSIKLREAFKDEILALNPAQFSLQEDLPTFLEKSFNKHREAIYDFSFTLSESKRDVFYEKWYEYFCHSNARNNNVVPFFEQYSCRGLTVEQQHEMKRNVRKRIEAILDFAECL